MDDVDRECQSQGKVLFEPPGEVSDFYPFAKYALGNRTSSGILRTHILFLQLPKYAEVRSVSYLIIFC